MTSQDNTAEQLRACREVFEEGVKKWTNYSDRTLIRDGRYPDYYGNPVVQGAWEGFKLGLRTRADSGEAVAWTSQQDIDYLKCCEHAGEIEVYAHPCKATPIPLFTHPSATALDVQDAENMAIKFHEAYERLAPSFGYETRTDTRAFCAESANGKLMIAVCAEILGDQSRVSPVDEAKAFSDWFKGEQGKAYDGMWCFARAAWMHRAALSQRVEKGNATEVGL